MIPLEDAFARHLAGLQLTSGVGLVAVSGGPDSLALLHLLVRCRDAHGLRLVVAHADHGIHPDSARIAVAVAEAASALGVPCEVGQLRLGPGAGEGAARAARYAWLSSRLDRFGEGVILTAHHRDDQIETVLMRFLSGSGPAGLAGMAEVRPRLVRPLLTFGRAEIREYLAGLAVTAWEDPANLSPAHLRSWLRGSVIPLIGQHLPDLGRRILAVGRQAAADRAGWDALLDVLPLELRIEPDGVSVASGILRAYDTWLGTALVAAVARRSGLALGDRRASRVLQLARLGRTGARVELGGGWIAETGFGRLALVRPGPGIALSGRLTGRQGELGWGPWRVRWGPDPAPSVLVRDAAVTWVIPGEYELRSWRPGDRIRPLGGSGRRLVVRCMQDRQVPRRNRSAWPVLESEDVIVWVPGVCRSDARVPAAGTEAMRIDVEQA